MTLKRRTPSPRRGETTSSTCWRMTPMPACWNGRPLPVTSGTIWLEPSNCTNNVPISNLPMPHSSSRGRECRWTEASTTKLPHCSRRRWDSIRTLPTPSSIGPTSTCSVESPRMPWSTWNDASNSVRIICWRVSVSPRSKWRRRIWTVRPNPSTRPKISIPIRPRCIRTAERCTSPREISPRRGPNSIARSRARREIPRRTSTRRCAS
mmetsp:Transcript_42905/g.130572  ORF Transcript_42905/g.130572 Transcript_42905/m.130572 type:complete len:208 (-) Transcript_42905:338-961(-)